VGGFDEQLPPLRRGNRLAGGGVGMKIEVKRLTLTAEQQSLLFHALIALRNKRLAEGKTVYTIDDVILKLAE
jgi:hypothetical protein